MMNLMYDSLYILEIYYMEPIYAGIILTRIVVSLL